MSAVCTEAKISSRAERKVSLHQRWKGKKNKYCGFENQFQAEATVHVVGTAKASVASAVRCSSAFKSTNGNPVPFVLFKQWQLEHKAGPQLPRTKLGLSEAAKLRYGFQLLEELAWFFLL